jgi:hypothetical protein
MFFVFSGVENVEIGKTLEINFGHNKNTFLYYVFKKVEK